MKDIVERLRSPFGQDKVLGQTIGPSPDDLDDAADEITALRKRVEVLEAFEQTLPLPYDVLTGAEMRAAKGNWRSLIDQMNNARQALRDKPNG